MSEHATQKDLDRLAEIAAMLCERPLRKRLMQAPDDRAVQAAIVDGGLYRAGLIAADPAAASRGGQPVEARVRAPTPAPEARQSRERDRQG